MGEEEYPATSQVSLLNLSDKRITHLSASLSRATIVTEDNQVAVLVDQNFPDIAQFIQVCLAEQCSPTLRNSFRFV